MILSLLGEKFHRSLKAFAGLDRLNQLRIRQAGIQQIGLPAQLGGRVGVGMGDQGEAIQSRNPPVHGRVGGKAGFHRVDIGGQVLEALFYGVEPGKSSEQGKMRRPDMSGDEYRLRAGLQRDFQKVPAVQSQNRASVGVNIADGLQPVGKVFRIL